MDRRNFLKSLAGVGVSVCVAEALLTACENYSTVDSPYSGIDVTLDLNDRDMITQDEFDTLKHINRGVVKTFRSGKLRQYSKVNYGIPVVILRLTAEGVFAVYSSMCTHAQCLMTNTDTEIPFGDYRNNPKLIDDTYFNCHCHGSQFDPFQDGKAVHGPAESPLKKFACEFDSANEKLTIHF